jgi:hypothetical protein
MIEDTPMFGGTSWLAPRLAALAELSDLPLEADRPAGPAPLVARVADDDEDFEDDDDDDDDDRGRDDDDDDDRPRRKPAPGGIRKR